jgi:hypothetical protein
MAFTLFDMLAETYKRLGQWNESIVTGSTLAKTAIEDSTLANEGSDDDWNRGAFFHIYNTSVAGAAPQGEFVLITDYVDSSGKFTFNTLSCTPDTGDRYGYVSEFYPLQTMIGLANSALQSIGDIPLVDKATVSSAVQKEYVYDVSWKRAPPYRVDLQTKINSTADANAWEMISAWDYEPATAGSSAKIIFEDYLPIGRKLRIWYRDKHPYVQASTDPVYEGIQPELATLTLVERALEWQNSRLQGGDQFLLQRWNDAKQQTLLARSMYPVWKPKRRSKILQLDGEDSGDHLPYVNPYGPG